MKTAARNLCHSRIEIDPRRGRRRRLGVVGIALLGASVLALADDAAAQDWLQRPIAPFEIEDNRGRDRRLDEPGENIVGVASTANDGGRQGRLLRPPEAIASAGYELRAEASFLRLEGRALRKRRCRIEWTLTNTSAPPPAANITAFSSGIRELDTAVQAALPVVPGEVVTATKENGCGVRIRRIAGPTFNPDAPELITFDLESDSLGDCLTDDEPAATLLYPYFEVDLDDPGGVTTIVSMNNAGDTCALVRVMLWTDLAVPTLAFYVYLAPDDVQPLNLRSVLNGDLPDTSEVLDDFRCPVLDVPVCRPEELAAGLTVDEVASLEADHTGVSNPISGTCAGVPRFDRTARGYVTADVVSSCAFPPTATAHTRPEWDAEDGFFNATGTTASSDVNQLWGDWFIVDFANDFAQSETAVHIVADGERFEDGDYTFYGRYNGFDGSDGRVPLSGRSSLRFLNGGPFDGGTDLFVWRDSRSPAVAPVTCGELPSWGPLGQRGIRLFNEDQLPFQPVSTAVFPWATQRVPVTATMFTPIAFGWLDLDLWHDVETPAQAWVSGVLSARGRFSIHHEATRLDDLCDVPAVPEPTP